MTITYDGYVANLSVDPDAGIIHGEVINTRHVLTFSCTDASQLHEAFKATIKDYRAWCLEEGVEPEKPYSGQVPLRMGGELHRLAATRAATEKMSLNAWLVRTVQCELGQRPAHLTHAEFESRLAKGVRDEMLRVVRQTVSHVSDDADLWSNQEDRLH
jgi:predicted HicB family RNase H-like nuclease